MIDLFDAAPFVRLHRGRTVVVKIGGSSLAKPKLRRQLARQLATIQAFGAHVVVVHGGGPQTGRVQEMLGETPRVVDGRRVTSATGLRALRWATAGELNGDLAAALTAEGGRAVGFCAGTGGILEARRRDPMQTSEGMVDFGEVGDVRSVDPSVLRTLVENGIVPVICPPAGDGEGGFLNVNADLAAAAIAAGMQAAKLVLCTDQPGILGDPRDPNTLHSALSLHELGELERSGSFEGGMRVKAAAIRRALQAGVERVHVVSGLDPEALVGELYTTQGTGTLITLEPQTVPGTGANGEPTPSGDLAWKS